MVQAAPNLAQMQGRIIALCDVENSSDFTSATLAIDQIHDIEGHRNLLAWAVGKQIQILLPNERVTQLALQPGQALRFLAEKTGPRHVYARSDQMTVMD